MVATSNIETNNGSSKPAFPDLSQFSWQEKLTWLNGYDIWSLHPLPGITPQGDATSIRLSDGPHGVRKPLSDLDLAEAYPATTFPSACATACSWDPQLLHTMGQALAKESEYYDVQVLLGPGVNLKRYPTGGRNHEYFSEDPYLTGKLACGYIEGVQHTGKVASCIKHFCLNNQESHRMVVDVLCDERALRELYLPAFEMAIHNKPAEKQPRTIMTAYNRVEGEYASESVRLLQHILRDEWGFQGLVMSDWAAVSDRVEALRAGMDLEMPGSKNAYDQEVHQAIHDGTLPVSAIEDCAERVARLIYDYQPKGVHHDYTDTSKAQGMFDEHDQLARQIAQECIVLLQNKDNILPLNQKATRNIAVIGDFAKNSRYQGMGSAHATPTKVTSLYTALHDTLKRDGGDFSLSFAPGYDADEDDDDVHQQLIDEAVEVAMKGDVVLVSVGLPEIMESEGFDRPHIHMPEEHVRLVESICERHSNVVVMLSNGGIVTIPESIVNGAKAILDGFLLGQAGGAAMVDVLFGHANPSGKLPETIPGSIDDIPAASYFPGSRDLVQYREGLNVGYRYFNTQDIEVRFPFGHGLSYTTFEYANQKVEVRTDEEKIKQVLVSLDVKNTGSTTGKEVVQVYVKPIKSSVYRPLHELKSFKKVEIAPGKSERVEFELDFRSFAYFDIGCNDWIVESGPCSFEIQIGASSRDIRLKETLQFKTGTVTTKEAQQAYPNSVLEESKAFISKLEDESFAKRFGLKKKDIIMGMIEDEKQRRKKGSFMPIHRNTLLKEAAEESFIARALMRFTIKVACKRVHEGPTKKREVRMITANVENLPLRNLVLFSQGAITFEILDSLILLMNGKYWKGFRGLVVGNKNKKRLSRRRTSSQESLV